MTRIATALFAVASLAIGAGCADERPPQSRATVRGGLAKVVTESRASSTADRTAGQKSEAFVISGDEDTPKAVTPATKQGKQRAGRSPRPPVEPAKPKEPNLYATGEFRTTKEKARETAIQEAVAKLHDHLLQQQPAVITYPTVEMVRKLIVAHPSATESDP